MRLKNKTTKSQNDRLLTYEAFEVLHICRISARVADLRDRGYQIDTIMHRETVDGMPKVWGQYVLRGIV